MIKTFYRDNLSSLKAALFCFVLIVSLLIISAAPVFAQSGKLPVILIPGLSGSELVNKKTGEVVWFKASRSKVDDIRLPVFGNLAENRDDLVPRDILRSIKVGIKIDAYGGIVSAMQSRGGYTEGNWDDPGARGYENTVYVFPYDWRRDNVENAQLLIGKVAELKRKLNRPELKFNVVGHSMGGIIARYAAMYGDADLNMEKTAPRPTWDGAKHFNRIIVLGTPSEGSTLSLNSLVNGFSVGGMTINLPFILNPSKFDVFTLPSAFQLLPAGGTLQALDENFKPMDVDIYDPETWKTYGWGAFDDKKFDKYFNDAERANAKSYFFGSLDRARRLHEALAVSGGGAGPVAIDVIGAECKDTQDSIVIYRDAKTNGTNGWKTLFRPAAFTRSNGRKVSLEETKRAMMSPGDGVVTKRSLMTATQSKTAGISSILYQGSTSIVCEAHNSLPANVEVQNKIIQLLASGSSVNTAASAAGFPINGNSLYIKSYTGSGQNKFIR